MPHQYNQLTDKPNRIMLRIDAKEGTVEEVDDAVVGELELQRLPDLLDGRRGD